MSKSSRDQQIGRNLVELRGDTSQADLAMRMRERGYKWSAATVWSIEKGDRPLKFTEVEDLLDILGVDLHLGVDELLNTDFLFLRFLRDKTASMRRTSNEIDELLPRLASDAISLAMFAAHQRDQLTEPDNRYLLEEICGRLEYAGKANMAANTDHLLRALETVKPDEWISQNAPFSTFLFGTFEQIDEARAELGLNNPE